jgi:hypothetical protein
VRQRLVLFLTLTAAVLAMSSAANAGGCGGCGGCGSAYYTRGLVACDAHRIYVVNQGPTYSGPAIMTYPTYIARSYPYVHGGCGFSSCYHASYTTPVVHYDHRYHHRQYSDHYRVRTRHHYDRTDDYDVRPRRRSVPRVVYVDEDRRHRTGVHYRGPKSPMYRTKRHHHPHPLPPK